MYREREKRNNKIQYTMHRILRKYHHEGEENRQESNKIKKRYTH